ncbi:hypothetical protein CQJ94_17165 [Glycomyces fuscus]|nr:hypothetical protein CQJ94_17165 [Glycomyces fuscus]
MASVRTDRWEHWFHPSPSLPAVGPLDMVEEQEQQDLRVPVPGFERGDGPAGGDAERGKRGGGTVSVAIF